MNRIPNLDVIDYIKSIEYTFDKHRMFFWCSLVIFPIVHWNVTGFVAGNFILSVLAYGAVRFILERTGLFASYFEMKSVHEDDLGDLFAEVEAAKEEHDGGSDT